MLVHLLQYVNGVYPKRCTCLTHFTELTIHLRLLLTPFRIHWLQVKYPYNQCPLSSHFVTKSKSINMKDRMIYKWLQKWSSCLFTMCLSCLMYFSLCSVLQIVKCSSIDDLHLYVHELKLLTDRWGIGQYKSTYSYDFKSSSSSSFSACFLISFLTNSFDLPSRSMFRTVLSENVTCNLFFALLCIRHITDEQAITHCGKTSFPRMILTEVLLHTLVSP